jgi:hypothetical protein
LWGRAIKNLLNKISMILKMNPNRFKSLANLQLLDTLLNVLKHLMEEVEKPVISCKVLEKEKKRNLV